MIRGLARLFIDMGRILIMLALVVMIVGVAGVLLPSGAARAALDGLIGRVPALAQLFGGQPEPYAMLEPDELIYDNLLGAEVPRVYYLEIPKIALDAPVVAVDVTPVSLEGKSVGQLHVPHAYAVGWSAASAQIGVAGNTVFVGHNNIYGEVFKDLWQLQQGDQITVRTGSGDRTYRVTQIVTFEERDLSLEVRLQNARWIGPTSDERLTLVTCWPYWNNTHRLVVVAVPDSRAAN